MGWDGKAKAALERILPVFADKPFIDLQNRLGQGVSFLWNEKKFTPIASI
jgi:hypothetical protein